MSPVQKESKKKKRDVVLLFETSKKKQIFFFQTPIGVLDHVHVSRKHIALPIKQKNGREKKFIKRVLPVSFFCVFHAKGKSENPNLLQKRVVKNGGSPKS